MRARSLHWGPATMALSLALAAMPVHAQPSLELLPEEDSPQADIILEVDASTDLAQVIDDHWAFTLEQNPLFATRSGVRDYDDRLGSQSPEAFQARAEANRRFADRLEAIDPDALSEDEALNRNLLLQITRREAKSVEVGYHRLSVFMTSGSWHRSFGGAPARLPFFTQADYESYVARLNDYGRFNREGIALLREGLGEGVAQACAPMDGYGETISSYVVDDPATSSFMAPFKSMPETIPAAERARLQEEGLAAVRDVVIPAYQELYTFFTDEYLPECRDKAGISTVPGGTALYDHAVAYHTTTSMTAREIHALGQREVARILAEMDQVVERAGFDGDRKAFVSFLRSDPQFYPKTADERLMRAAWISKRMDGELPKLFGRLPRVPYTVKPIPLTFAASTTTAYYQPSAPDGTVAGVYYVNTTKLNERPLYELEALSLHEAVPGHHLQIALAQELDLPDFRRSARFTAYVEGWGLYAERLGLEVGFYQDPYSDFGRLSYEMWRACRLVVDTGMHALGWSRDEAIAFMLENTALSRSNIEAEVNRYISWPGQALAYKIGELKLRELRERARVALGDGFDVRMFHDEVLAKGAMPLDLLEARIDRWIDTSQL